MENKSLLIIGNGADRYAKLDSTFDLFMKNKVNIIDETYNIFRSFRITASEYLNQNNKQMRDDFRVFKMGLLPFYIKLSDYDSETSIENLKSEMLNYLHSVDLKRSLSLTFSNIKNDYVEFEKSYQEINDYSFWEIFIACLRISDLSWYDIEKKIENFFTGVLEKRKLRNTISHYLYGALDDMKSGNYRYPTLNGQNYDIKTEDLYMFALYYILDKYDGNFNSEEDIDKILLASCINLKKVFQNIYPKI